MSNGTVTRPLQNLTWKAFARNSVTFSSLKGRKER